MNLLLLFSTILYFSLHVDTKWKQVGITLAGGNGQGDKVNQLDLPFSIFIDHDRTIYITNYSNHRMVEWKSNVKNGKTVVDENGKGN
jgi:hypothetical protein